MRAIVAIALLSAGCPANLEAQSHLSKLRVLGITPLGGPVGSLAGLRR